MHWFFILTITFFIAQSSIHYFQICLLIIYWFLLYDYLCKHILHFFQNLIRNYYILDCSNSYHLEDLHVFLLCYFYWFLLMEGICCLVIFVCENMLHLICVSPMGLIWENFSSKRVWFKFCWWKWLFSF